MNESQNKKVIDNITRVLSKKRFVTDILFQQQTWKKNRIINFQALGSVQILAMTS